MDHDFQLNRYDINSMLDIVKSLDTIKAEIPLEIAAPYLSIEILDADQVSREFLTEVIAHFGEFDNEMQERFQQSYEREERDLIYYQFEPALLMIRENRAEICYWGVHVNTEYVAAFVKEGDLWSMESRS